MVTVILDNIRSVHNVGSIFRTCDAAGVEKLYLCGTTPTPVDRFGRTRADLAKVALGSEKIVAWEYAQDITSTITRLKEEGIGVIAVEQTDDAVDYRTLTLSGHAAFVFGNEVDGVSHDALSLCDAAVAIPMHGTKESLNVSVAAGIILFSFQPRD
jgi:tRNA G18 (ribose-2'-O)-methylase SpoU